MIPGPSQFVNKVGGYLGNVAKEAGQFGSAWKTAFNASADITPGANQRAAQANMNQQNAQGQLLGAILQGRRYNNKGKQM